MGTKLKWTSKATTELGDARAWQLRATQLLDASRIEEALAVLQRGLEQFPNDVGLLINLGETQRRSGRLEDAAGTLVQAVQRAPEIVEASFNLGVTLKQLKESEAALACLTRAADLAPDRFAVQLQLAELLRQSGDAGRAVGHYHAALALSPSSFETLIGLAISLRALHRYEGAAGAARRAIALRSESPVGHHELGKALFGLGRHDSAILSFRQALSLNADRADSHFGLACALMEVGGLGEALAHLRRSLELEPSDHYVHSNLVFMMSFDAASSAQDILREAQRWAKAHAEPLQAIEPTYACSREPQRRLRIGYVGATYRDHCQAFFLDPLWCHHDRAGYEIVAYSSTPSADSVTDRLRSLVDLWRDVRSLDDASLVELIRSDQIDVLVDLNMHMEFSRLRVFAHRPAPVQITWLAYPGTTGLSSIDYRISDALLDPGTEQPSDYSERTLRLSGSFWCYDPLRSDPVVSQLPAIANGYITFGCLNASWKLNRETFAVWAGVLRHLPRSRLLVLAPAGRAADFVLSSLEELGVARERVECLPRQPRLDYLATYQRIDVCLDTIPYNGHTTSLDAFWMGVPVVTLVGDRVVGRAGYAQATLLGLPQLIANDPQQFVERAAALAENLPALAELRAALRERLTASKLMDAAGFTSSLERAYRSAWQSWCSAVPGTRKE